MTQRSIFSGKAPQIIVRAGGNAVVKGWDSDRVEAEGSGFWGLQVKRKKDTIEISFGASGQVLVPFGSSVKVYTGKSAEVYEINGTISAYAGQDVRISQGNVLVHASAGKTMDIDCRTIEGANLKLSAGRDLRCWLRDLKNARYLIDDLGGKWQAVVGDGSAVVRLVAGGDVTLVTDQQIAAQSPDFILGKIERSSVQIWEGHKEK